MKEKRLLTIPQAAEELGVTTETVKNYIRKGVIRARSVGGWTMIDRKSYDTLFDDLSDLAEMGENLKLLKQELVEENKTHSDLLRDAKESNSLIGIVRRSNINVHLVNRIIRSMGDGILTVREAEILTRFLECADVRTVAKEYDLTPCRIREIINKSINKFWKLTSYSDIVAENAALKEERNNLHVALAHLTDANRELKVQCGHWDEDTAAILLECPITEEDVGKCEFLFRELREFDLTTRTLHGLMGGNIETVGDMVSLTGRELLKLRNFGKKSLREVEDFVEDHGLSLGMDVDELKSRYSLYLAKRQNENQDNDLKEVV